MQRFETGDKVRIVLDTTRGGTGYAEGWKHDGAFAGKVGFIGYVLNSTESKYSVFPTEEAARDRDVLAGGGYFGWHNENDLEPLSEGLGVLHHPYRDYDKKVLGKFTHRGGSVYLVTEDTDDGGLSIASQSGLGENGWSFPEDESEVQEFTLAELAEKLNMPVENLRIKD